MQKQNKEILSEFQEDELKESLDRFDKVLDRLENCLDELEKEMIHKKQ